MPNEERRDFFNLKSIGVAFDNDLNPRDLYAISPTTKNK
jgi:hypothetical protein